MATGGAGPKTAQRKGEVFQVCRYFLHGACSKGKDCRYMHDKSRAVPADNICKFYLAGTCVYGDRCRYDHVKSRKVGDIDTSRHDKFERKSEMVTLKKGGLDQSLADAEKKKKRVDYEKSWLNAKEFVPGQTFYGSVPGSYAQAVEPEVYGAEGGACRLPAPPEVKEDDLLCPYFAHGDCPFGSECEYAHGDICDMCGLPKLHPKNAQQREAHQKECLLEHEQEMELAFLVKESCEKECGICMEVIKEKVSEKGFHVDRRFGILENCNHCFCLSCIKEWRAKRFAEKSTHRQCPICRTHSNFVTPSEFWVEEADKKEKLIAEYKAQIGKKPCQYFKQGKGECPFYDKCFYLHALPDGSIAPPTERPKRRRRFDDGGESNLLEDYSLWDYFATRDSLVENFLSLDDELSLILLDAFESDFEDSSDSDTDESSDTN